jgi:hypothetical protein
MTVIIRGEVRKRGFFGWLFLLISVAFSAFVLATLLLGMGDIVNISGLVSGLRHTQGISTVYWASGGMLLVLLALAKL